jgi:AraC family transcriptional regulator
MERTHRGLWFAVITAGLALAGPLAARPAQAPGNTPQKSPEPFASIQEVKPFVYCCIVHKGPLADMSAVIGQLMQAMQGQNLFASIQGPVVGVYYNSPADTKPGELLWEVGFPVAEGATPQSPLGKKEWKYASVATAVHKGPYAKAGETIQRLMDWAKAKGYAIAGPTMERYLNNPMQVKPEELRTEIWIPVKRK